MTAMSNIAERRGQCIGSIALPLRPPSRRQQAEAPGEAAQTACPLLQKNLDELGLIEYLPKLVANGFDTWDKVLLISEDDFERLEVKLGHRRKLQRKMSYYIDGLRQDNPNCDEELLANETGNHDYTDQLGQIRKHSTSSSSKSSDSSGHTTKPICLASSANTIEVSLISRCSTLQSADGYSQSLNAVLANMNEIPDLSTHTSSPLYSDFATSAPTQNNQMNAQKENAHPTKCLFVQPWIGTHANPQEILYRAIYVRQHTVDSFLHCLAMKCGVSRCQIAEVSWVSKYGEQLFFDDNVVRNLAHEQDMIAKFEETEVSLPWRFSQAGGDTVSIGENPVDLKYYAVQLIF